jgi:hypothetical protein
MTAAYLWFNALLYAVFAVWCTLRPAATARALGYGALERGGQSEFLVVYGGLQLGLAIAFALLGANPSLHRAGLQIALALYGGIVAFRAVTLWMYAPVPAVTCAVAALELALLVAAAAIWMTRQP